MGLVKGISFQICIYISFGYGCVKFRECLSRAALLEFDVP